MDRMAILAKTPKRHKGKSERGGLQQPLPPLPPPPSWERGLRYRYATSQTTTEMKYLFGKLKFGYDVIIKLFRRLLIGPLSAARKNKCLFVSKMKFILNYFLLSYQALWIAPFRCIFYLWLLESFMYHMDYRGFILFEKEGHLLNDFFKTYQCNIYCQLRWMIGTFWEHIHYSQWLLIRSEARLADRAEVGTSI